jgi:hypothetical protein
MVEDVIGTRDPKSVAKFLVAEGYLEDPHKPSRKRRPKVDFSNRRAPDARQAQEESVTEAGRPKVAIYLPPKRGLPYLVVTIVNGYVTSFLAVQAKEEAGQLAIDASKQASRS